MKNFCRIIKKHRRNQHRTFFFFLLFDHGIKSPNRISLKSCHRTASVKDKYNFCRLFPLALPAKFPVKLVKDFSHIARNSLPAFFPQLLRHSIKSFCNTTRNSRQSICITTNRNCISYSILEILCFQKSNDCFRYCFLTALHMTIKWPDLIQCSVQIIMKFSCYIFTDLFL